MVYFSKMFSFIFENYSNLQDYVYVGLSIQLRFIYLYI
jgi:hypothetical protein